MSTTPLPTTEAAEPKRVKKRLYLPLIFLILFLLIGVGFYVRGTWADKETKNPTRPEDGTITRLLEQKNGNVVVRCAVVVDAPPKQVWDVVIDYPSHKSFLDYVADVKGTKQEDGRILVEGVAHSRLWGDWPFASVVTHSELPDEEYGTSWSEEDKDVFKVSRGSWSVTPLGKDKNQTLLVFTLQIELKDHPNFIVRNVIMDRLHSVVRAMRDEALRRKHS